VVIPGSGLEICLSLELILMPVLPVAVLGTGYLSSIFLLAPDVVILRWFMLDHPSKVSSYYHVLFYLIFLLYAIMGLWFIILSFYYDLFLLSESLFF